MHLLWFLLFGLVVGVIARLIVPGRQPGGWIVSIVIGISAPSSVASWDGWGASTNEGSRLAG